LGIQKDRRHILQTGESESPGFLAEPTLRLIKSFSFPWGVFAISSIEVMLLIPITYFT